MARKRFSRNAICNSDNYKASKYSHREYIKEQHVKNIIIVEELIKEIHIKKAYIRVFGKLIPITIEEAKKVEHTVSIIWE